MDAACSCIHPAAQRFAKTSPGRSFIAGKAANIGLMAKQGKIRIGISGWTYPPWRGVFYPEKLKQSEELHYAAHNFRSIEINGTFYGLQKPESFEHWRATTPDDFVFSVKAPRFITHIRRLRDVATPVANFFSSGVLRLGPKFGPVLWQLPPNLKFDAAVLEDFLALLPHDTDEAVALAKRHDARMNGRDACETDKTRPVRHAMEIRNDSFRDPAFIKLLRKYQVALVCADTVEWPRLMDLTADFIYCRLHGSEKLYASGYTEAALDEWANRIRAWTSGAEPEQAERIMPPLKPRKTGRDVYMYFDNDIKVKAPENADALYKKLK